MLGSGLVSSLSAGVVLCGLSPSAKAFMVNAGTDYLITPAGGTSATITNPVTGIGTITINLKGLPIGSQTTPLPNGGYSGLADTVINRDLDVNVTPAGEQTPIEIVGLSLRSIAPINIGGNDYDAFVGLQKYYPASLGGGALSTGSMTIRDTGLPGGKTWDSNFVLRDVVVLAPTGTLTPTENDFVRSLIEGCGVATNYACVASDPITLATSQSAEWSDNTSTGPLRGLNLVTPGVPQNFYPTGTALFTSPTKNHGPRSAPAPLAILGVPTVFASLGRLKKLTTRLKVITAAA